jgi:hypothetical protein
MGNNLQPENDFVKDPDNHWVGPYGVRVSTKLDAVISFDGHNAYFSDGTQSQIFQKQYPILPAEEYLSQYAFLGSDGFYYYKFRTSHLFVKVRH